MIYLLAGAGAVGLVMFGLQESADPASPLFNNILSVNDLDRMSPHLPIAQQN